MAFARCAILMIACVAFDNVFLQAEERQPIDVTFASTQQSIRPKTADFYFSGRAIGRGRDGFRAIIERIRELPPGASIVWGPNYRRCGACSGSEPECVPRYLYPDLWKELEEIVAARGHTLSSDYPWPGAKRPPGVQDIPLPSVLAQATPKGARFDAILDWQPNVDRPNDALDPFEKSEDTSSPFSADGKSLSGYDLRLFFGQLPQESHVLIRISPDPKAIQTPEQIEKLAKAIRGDWDLRIADDVRRGKLQAVVTVPPALSEALEKPQEGPPQLAITWTNYHGADTPPEEVLYFANGQFVGRGTAAIDRLLQQLNELPPGSPVYVPRYEYGGRWAIETFSAEELAARNAELASLFPINFRRDELKDVLKARQLTIHFWDAPLRRTTLLTVADWGGGDRYGAAFVTTGRIVRHDERSSAPAARVGWTRYEAAKTRAYDDRELENTAVYTVDDAEVGAGVEGFAAAMDRLAGLPEGSVVHVRVCLRTKAPFLCPLIYEGHRHFERTGFEPYFGMFPWLLDAAQKRKLNIEWIPDEGKSCGDCELNR